MHTCTQICIHTYLHTDIHTHTYVHMYRRTYTSIRTYVHSYVHTSIRTYVHTYICTYPALHERVYSASRIDWNSSADFKWFDIFIDYLVNMRIHACRIDSNISPNRLEQLCWIDQLVFISLDGPPNWFDVLRHVTEQIRILKIRWHRTRVHHGCVAKAIQYAQYVDLPNWFDLWTCSGQTHFIFGVQLAA